MIPVSFCPSICHDPPRHGEQSDLYLLICTSFRPQRRLRLHQEPASSTYLSDRDCHLLPNQIMFGADLLVLWAALELAAAHTVISYPGWRGDNLHQNGTLPQDNPNSLGIDLLENGTVAYPWGMQWIYPCKSPNSHTPHSSDTLVTGGGMPQSTNRSLWPVSGGALSFQPGWFPGHSKALIYVNIGIQAPGDLAPPNMSHPVVPPFQIVGPDNTYYSGSVCLPQIGMPANLSLQIGQNITLQIIETAQHGAALYNVSVHREDCKEYG